MKRFIDLTNQITENTREFAFYDTITNSFEVFSGSITWRNWDAFKKDYDGEDLERYRRLCCNWILENNKKEKNENIN